MILAPSQGYTVSQVITNPGAVSNLGLQASATKPFLVIRAKIELAQAAIPTAANARGILVRKTAAPTYTAIANTAHLNHNPTDADASFTAGHTATAEGTDGDGYPFGWGDTTGWTWSWDPTPEEYILVVPGTANGIAIKHVTAPPAGVYVFLMTVREIG